MEKQMDVKRLEYLLARVEAAEDFDRELDRDIGLEIGGWRMEEQPPHGLLLFVPEDETYYSPHPGAMYPSLTESIDAACGLVERLLPGWWGNVDYGDWQDNPYFARLNYRENAAKANGQGATPALAILSALLKALIANAATATPPAPATASTA